jgi:hypothetical protein
MLNLCNLIYGKYSESWVRGYLIPSQNEGLSPSGIALSFDKFGSISWHSV